MEQGQRDLEAGGKVSRRVINLPSVAGIVAARTMV